jgi:LmbE family N-acetylglucosaminyl deacetylase
VYDKLMIVAHPDDESIFGGGNLIKHKGWKVICVTNGDNPIRAKEFKKAMKTVDAEYEMWNYEDKWKGDFDRKSLRKDLKRVLQKKEYKMIVTHGLSGEYGHTQHKALAEIIHGLVKKNLYTFKLSKKSLKQQQLKKKLKLLSIYKSQDIKYLKKYIIREGLKKIN